MKYSNLIIQATTALTFAACTNTPSSGGDATPVAPLKQDIVAASAEHDSYELTVVRRTDDELKAFGRQVASLVLETTLDGATFDTLEKPSQSDVVYASDESHQLFLVYEPSFGILRLLRQDVSSDYTSDGDVGPDVAREIYRACALRLLDAGVLDRQGLDVENPELNLHTQSEGEVGKEPEVRTKEYVFFAKRRLGGASIRHGVREAGVQVSVHRNGEIASVRFQVSRVGAATRVSEVVGEAQAAELARKQFPGQIIEPKGLTYVQDASGSFRLTWDYQAHLQVTIEGRPVNSRAEYGSFAVGRSADATIWPIAEPDATGDPR